MPEILNKSSFSPDKEARDKWLSTRKSRIEGTTHPGYFQTVNYSIDTNWVILVAIIELTAAGVTIYGSIFKGLGYMIVALVAVAVFIGLDIIGANWHHYHIKEKRKSKGKLSVVEYDIKFKNFYKDSIESLKDKRVGYETDLNEKSQRKFWGTIMIIFSALLKLGALFAFSTLNFTFIIIMVVLYIIAVYIHLNHTGYYMAENRTKKAFEKQHRHWRDLQKLETKGETPPSNHKGKELVVRDSINSTIKINKKIWRHDDNANGETINVEDHKIEFEFFNNGLYTYAISTKGILTDDDIKSFINVGKEIDSEIIAMECLRHQTDKIHS